MNRSIHPFPFFATLAGFVVSFSARNAIAQDHPMMMTGVVAGYERLIYHSDPFPMLSVAPQEFIAQNGCGNGYYFGLSLEHCFLIPEHLYYLLELGYNSMPANFSGHNYTRPGDSLYGYSVMLRSKLSYTMINWGMKYDLISDSVPRGFGVQACLSIGTKSEGTYWKSITINSSSVSDVSAIQNAVGIRLSVRSEITYDWPASKFWICTLSVGYDAPITKVDPDNNWRASSFYDGIAVRYAVW